MMDSELHPLEVEQWLAHAHITGECLDCGNKVEWGSDGNGEDGPCLPDPYCDACSLAAEMQPVSFIDDPLYASYA